MTNDKLNYVFGPAFSRRLGKSLGVDVIPFKTCTYDCIYCQLGKTPQKTVQRKDYVPLQPVLDELKENGNFTLSISNGESNNRASNPIY